jgi:hypothetical protein
VTVQPVNLNMPGCSNFGTIPNGGLRVRNGLRSALLGVAHENCHIGTPRVGENGLNVCVRGVCIPLTRITRSSTRSSRAVSSSWINWKVDDSPNTWRGDNGGGGGGGGVFGGVLKMAKRAWTLARKSVTNAASAVADAAANIDSWDVITLKKIMPNRIDSINYIGSIIVGVCLMYHIFSARYMYNRLISNKTYFNYVNGFLLISNFTSCCARVDSHDVRNVCAVRIYIS